MNTPHLTDHISTARTSWFFERDNKIVQAQKLVFEHLMDKYDRIGNKAKDIRPSDILHLVAGVSQERNIRRETGFLCHATDYVERQLHNRYGAQDADVAKAIKEAVKTARKFLIANKPRKIRTLGSWFGGWTFTDTDRKEQMQHRQTYCLMVAELARSQGK